LKGADILNTKKATLVALLTGSLLAVVAIAVVILLRVDSAIATVQDEACCPGMQWRREALSSALENGPSQVVVLVGDAVISRTAISFDALNFSDDLVVYGNPPELAVYVDGEWEPVPYHARVDGVFTTQMAFLKSGGEVRRGTYGFELLFGKLCPGRYMFIRCHWAGDTDSGYLLIEFTIDEDTPEHLPDELLAPLWENTPRWGQANPIDAGGKRTQ